MNMEEREREGGREVLAVSVLVMFQISTHKFIKKFLTLPLKLHKGTFAIFISESLYKRGGYLVFGVSWSPVLRYPL